MWSNGEVSLTHTHTHTHTHISLHDYWWGVLVVCTEYGVVNLFNLTAGVSLPRVWDTVCLHVYMCLSFLPAPCEVCQEV